MLSEQFLKLLTEEAVGFGTKLSKQHEEMFSTYADMLVQWNEKINLTAITDEEGIVIKHFLDSLSIIPYIPENAKTLIDVGTGAGFPGIPVKIVNDKISVTLLDSLEKRVKFLNEVINGLGLKDIYMPSTEGQKISGPTKNTGSSLTLPPPGRSQACLFSWNIAFPLLKWEERSSR